MEPLMERNGDFGPILTDLCKAVKVFLNHVDEKYRDKSLNLLQEKINKLRDTLSDQTYHAVSTDSVTSISSVVGSTQVFGIDEVGKNMFDKNKENKQKKKDSLDAE